MSKKPLANSEIGLIMLLILGSAAAGPKPGYRPSKKETAWLWITHLGILAIPISALIICFLHMYEVI